MRVARLVAYVAAVALLVASSTSHLMASVAAVPEVDGGMLSTGLAGLAAAALILRSRLRSK